MARVTYKEGHVKRISSVGIRGTHARLLSGILPASALAIAVLAAASLRGVDLLIAIIIAALIASSVIIIYLVKVTIEVSDSEVVISFRPVYIRKLALNEITSVTLSPLTSGQEGFGYRILGHNQRGFLEVVPVSPSAPPDARGSSPPQMHH